MTQPMRVHRFRGLFAAAFAMILAEPAVAGDAPGKMPLLGVQQGAGCTGIERLKTFERWFGRKPDLMFDFLGNRSWQEIENPGWWVNCWKKGAVHTVSLSVPMLPAGAPATSLREGAAGRFDERFTRLAKTLVAGGYGNAIIRLGWEFNGNWYSWSAVKNPEIWIRYWRRIVTLFRAVPGNHFLFDWCPSLLGSSMPPDRAYPGDAFVDLIGLDVYNVSDKTQDPQKRWQELLTMRYGLAWHRDFAAQHRKPMSFPEWGTGLRKDGKGGGDDPLFIQRMAVWMRENRAMYHSYWDETAGFNAKLSDDHQPLAGRAFKQAFGPN